MPVILIEAKNPSGYHVCTSGPPFVLGLHPTNKPNGPLYDGVTNSLERRIWQHKSKEVERFSKRYLTCLIHFEEFRDVRDAIAREKMIKGWLRSQK